METKYSAGLVSKPFWFVEFKLLLEVISQGKSESEIRDLCIEQNIFGASKEYRAKEIYRTVWKRAHYIDQELLQIFMQSDVATQKMIALIAILKENLLLFEFLYEVYRDAVLLGNQELTLQEGIRFLEQKAIHHSEVAEWTEVTKKRLASAYLNVMTDANLLSKKNRKRMITPQNLDYKLEEYLKKHQEQRLLEAITGGK